ncbi:acetyl-CoA hydrolase/transferase C-terminal domain-containing protein [uncultured Sneathiella sp.]|jgi:acyl-CoA hydrolase|uniref:acetyl-CoA hydrolase/transferase family protein n=1 Tax=uncultured Sneathiella sp. TaxID=879315 RepID=UPI0030D7556B|tara:strand:- start:5000 stop:6271 length:1272 start_codon:yes stop_codon:yes gene_type:complete
MRELTVAELDLSGLIKKSETVMWGNACAEPLTLTEALVEQRKSLDSVIIFMASAFSNTFSPEHAEDLTFISTGGVGTAGVLTKIGACDVIPCHVSQVAGYIETGKIPCDVVFVQLSPPNDRGEYSLGVTSDFIYTAVKKARIVIAEINSQTPRTFCSQPLTADDIDYCIYSNRPVVEMQPAPVTEIDCKISAFCQPFIPEKATLQVGIGGVPEALMADLSSRRGLGIHSGMIGDSVVDLVNSGAITNEHKEIDPGIIVTGALIGTKKLYDFADNNSALRMVPASVSHDIRVVSQLSNFVSMNSALEVDLTGQVNAEGIGAKYFGSVGGQVDYVRAAGLSPGGVSLIALRSSAKGGAVSKIVSQLSGPVTTPRSDVGVVVTELGAADLRGLPLSRRVKAMISIAPPEHRARLEREAYDLLKLSA